MRQSGAWAAIDRHLRVIGSGLFDDSLYEFEKNREQWSGRPMLACLESVHAMPKQGVTSMFTFGENFGFWKGVLRACCIPYILCTPQRWQKLLDITPAKAPPRADEDGKEMNRRLAQNKRALKEAVVDFVMRRFPGAKDHIQLKKDWGKADAICLAWYALQGDVIK